MLISMKRKVLGVICLLSILLLLELIQTSESYSAPKKSIKAARSSVAASVGEYSINIDGLSSPYASVVITVNDVFYRSTVAADDGTFSVTDILIQKSGGNFCFTSVDFKRVGESLSCLEIKPTQTVTDLSDIFLPPSIGLSKTKIAQGSESTVFGYTMPGAEVSVQLLYGVIAKLKADRNGYYSYKLSQLKAGKYALLASAVLGTTHSLKPLKPVTLEILSPLDQILTIIGDGLKTIWNFLLVPGFIYFSLLIILLLTICYLLIILCNKKKNASDIDKWIEEVYQNIK